jgi:hypothetical protein
VSEWPRVDGLATDWIDWKIEGDSLERNIQRLKGGYQRGDSFTLRFMAMIDDECQREVTQLCNLLRATNQGCTGLRYRAWLTPEEWVLIRLKYL